MNEVKRTYLALGLIVLAASASYGLWGAQFGFVGDFAPGLATEVLGILLTLIFVQRILDRRQAKDRARASRGGMRRAETPLRDLSELWASIISATLPHTPARPPRTYRALFKSEWAGWVERADLTEVRYAWSDETWLESAARVIRLSRRRISEILEVYSVHLDVGLIEVLDELRDDSFLANIETLGEQLRLGRSEPEFQPDAEEFSLTRTGPERARMMRKLMRALELYNESGLGEEQIDSVPDGLWKNDSPPPLRNPLHGI